MEEKELTRREREKLMHRRLILDAALKLFSERGFHNVSMQEIAEKAEFAIGTLYKFFENKDDLYRTLLEEKATILFTQSLEILAKDALPLKVIEEYVRANAAFVVEHQALIRLYLAEIRGFGKAHKALKDLEVRNLEIENKNKLAEVIERGIRENVFRDIDPMDAAIALSGFLEAFFITWLEDPESHPRGLNSDMILDLFFKGILNE